MTRMLRPEGPVYVLAPLLLSALVVAGGGADLEAQASGGDGSLLDKRAGLHIRSVPLEEALAALQSSSGVPLAFSPSLLPVDRLVSCSCREATVGEALGRILDETPFRIGVSAGQILLQPPVTAPREGRQVAGTVLDESGDPIPGGLVTLEDQAGRAIRSILTEGDGGFWIPVRREGVHRLRVERIGYRSVETALFEVPAVGMVRKDIRVVGEPIRLPAVKVEATRRDPGCILDPREGTVLAELWSQALQALRRVEVTEEEGSYRFALRRYERTVQIVTGRVFDEEWRTAPRSPTPFRSLPVEDLSRDGWVRGGKGGMIEYFGPDTRILRSRAFLEAHCFGLQEDPARARQVGLAFSPSRPGRAPGIEGVLWVDRKTAELKELHFHYTGHPHEPTMPATLLPLFGGLTSFRALPDGRWVVDRWRLRMPAFRAAGRAFARGGTPGGQVSHLGGRDADGVWRIVDRAPWKWRDRILRGELVFKEEGGELVGVERSGGPPFPF